MTAPFRWRWAVICVFILGTGLNYLDRQLLAAVMPTLIREFRLDLRAVGLVGTAFFICYGLCAPVWGWLIDRIGLTPVLVSAAGLWSVAGIATGSARSFTTLLVCRALLGVAESAVVPASGKVFATYLAARERSFGTALNQLGITLGMSSAPLLMSQLAGPYGWRSVFVGAGCAGLVWVPLWMLAARRIPPAVAPSRSSSLGLLRDRRVWSVVAANLLVMSLYGIWSFWVTLYFVREHGMNERLANQRYAWIPPVFATLGGLAGGWLAYWLAGRDADVQQARLRVCWWGAYLLLLTATIPWLSNAALAVTVISLSFFGCVMMSVNLYALPLDLFGPERAGFAIGLLTSAYGFYIAVQAPLVGWLWQIGQFRLVCLVSALLPLAAMLLLRWARIDTPRREV